MNKKIKWPALETTCLWLRVGKNKIFFFVTLPKIQRLFPLCAQFLLNQERTTYATEKNEKISDVPIHNKWLVDWIFPLDFFQMFIDQFSVEKSKMMMVKIDSFELYGRHADDTCELKMVRWDTWHRCETQYKQKPK